MSLMKGLTRSGTLGRLLPLLPMHVHLLSSKTSEKRKKKDLCCASLVTQMVKSPSAMQETWVQHLGRKDPLGKGMVTQSSILDWRTPWTEEPGRLQLMGSQIVGLD